LSDGHENRFVTGRFFGARSFAMVRERANVSVESLLIERGLKAAAKDK